jgi:hypothetical protein
LFRVTRVEVLDPDAALKDTEVWLGVSVPPVLDEPYVYETLIVPVMLESAVEVRVTVAVYVTPGAIPELLTTARDRVVGVVNAPVTPSQG